MNLPIKIVPTEEHKSGQTLTVTRFIENHDIFIFDCDGVIWHGNTLLEGADKTLRELEATDKKLYFVTNNSTKSRAGFLTKFWELGLRDIVQSKEQIVCAAHCTVTYLVKSGFKEQTANFVYVIGEQGLEEELNEAGIEWIGGTRDNGKTMNGPIVVDKRVGAVVVGLDRGFSYYKLQYAQICINEYGAKFIATNTDRLGHFDATQACVGSGGIVGAVEGCTGKKPFVIGKPERHMIDMLANALPAMQNFPPPYSGAPSTASHRMAMIGDRLDTDILFGHNAQITTVIALTGITSLNTLKAQLARAQVAREKNGDKDEVTKDTVMPTYYIDSMVLLGAS